MRNGRFRTLRRCCGSSSHVANNRQLIIRYDQAQLISSSLDFALLSDPSSPGLEPDERETITADRKRCFDLAADILKYCLRDLRSPEGGFYTAEDADSAQERGGKKSGRSCVISQAGLS
jgi:hypothetical protein